MSEQVNVPLRKLLVALESGSRPKGGVKGIDSGVPNLGREQLDSNGGFRLDRIRYVPTEFAATMRRGQIKAGDILVVKDGATTGKVSLVRKSFPYSDAVVNEHVFLCRCGQNVDSRYVFWYLFSARGQREILSDFRGAAQGGISQRFADLIEVPLQPLDQQHRIVAEIEKQFSRLDEAVANLKRVKAAVLIAAVEGRLVPTEAELARREGRGYETGEQLLQRILDTRRSQSKGENKINLPAAARVADAPSIPDGWVWCSIVQICQVASGNTPAGILDVVRVEGDVPWFKVGDMNHEDNQQKMHHADAWLSREDVARFGLRVFPQKTMLFPKRGGAISTNKKRLLDSPGCADLNVMGLIPFADVAPYFFAWFEGVDLGNLSDGSNVPQINHKDIEPLTLPLPPLAEQHRIVAEVDRRLSIVREVEAEVDANLKRAQALRQAVLGRAFSSSRDAVPSFV